MKCPRCGQINEQGQETCLRCGQALIQPDGMQAPTGNAGHPAPHRAPYSSPLGSSAEPVEATWREEPGAPDPARLAVMDQPAEPPEERQPDAQPALPPPQAPTQTATPPSRPSSASPASPAFPQPLQSPQARPSDESSPSAQPGAPGAPAFSPDDNPPPWLAQALHAHGRLPGADAPHAPYPGPQPQPPLQSGYQPDIGQTPGYGVPIRPGLAPNAPNMPGAPNMPSMPDTSNGNAQQGRAFPPRLIPERPRQPTEPLGQSGRIPDSQQGEWMGAISLNALNNPNLPNGRPGASGESGAGMPPRTPQRFPSDALFAPPSAPQPGAAPIPPRAPQRIPPMPKYPPLTNTPAAHAPTLQPGAILRGGRYRLLRRFDATPGGTPMNGPESAWPLMIASDSDTPSASVLIQELPLHGQEGYAASPMNNAEAIERRRILIAGRLRAIPPGVAAQVIDSFTENGRHFLVFEEPTGDLLNDRIQRARGPLAERTVVEYTLRIIEALLGLAEGRPPLPHGALSPMHVILRPNGSVTLVGISPNVLATADGATNAVMGPSGVPGYAAPEQARGQVTSRSDMYALGMMMRHMATGIPPWRQSDAGSTQMMRRVNPTLSLEFEEIVNRATRPSASQRFLTLDEMRRALASLMTRTPGRASDPRLGTGLTGVLPDLDEAVAARLGESASGAQRGRRAGALSQNPFFLVAVIFVLIALVGAGLVAYSQRGANHMAPPANTGPTPNPGVVLYQQQGIGISAGEFVFDKQQPDANLKEEAVRALAVGDQQTALNDYHQAVSMDISDAEAAIYVADLAIVLHHAPYVTFAVGVAFSGNSTSGPTDLDVDARDQLQGAYLAQEIINNSQLLPDGVQARILIVNSGPDASGVSAVARLLAAQINNGNPQHIVGLISWPEIAQAQAAVTAMQSIGLPVIGTAVGLDELAMSTSSATTTPTPTGGAMGGNYFAIVPSVVTQGSELADAVIQSQQLGYTQIALAVDEQDPVSVALAQGFAKEVSANQQTGARIVAHVSVTQGNNASYSAAAQVAQKQNASLLFIAGTDQDTVGIAQAAYHLGVSYHMLAGAEADTPALFGEGTDPLAQVARQNPSIFGDLYVTALADAFEPAAVGDPNQNQVLYDQNYLSVFGQSGIPSGLLNPDPGSVLAYDAVTLLAEATPINGQTGTPGKQSSPSPGQTTAIIYPTLTQVRSSLLGNNKQQGFQGISGLISFSLNGDQTQKSLAILKLTPNLNASASAPVATTTVLLVVGGKSVYCGPSNTCAN